MGPPPATPAPTRFLLSKRPHTQQSQRQAPSQQSSAGPQQFHATPKFSTSTPRPSYSASATTPALAVKTRTPRLRTTQDIIDDDSSPLSEEERGDGLSALPEPILPEPIDFDSSCVPQSSLPVQQENHDEDGDEDEYDDFDPPPRPKRRRISITSLSSSPSLIRGQDIIPVTSPQLSNSNNNNDDIEIDPPEDDDDGEEEDEVDLIITSIHCSSPPPQHDPDTDLDIPPSPIPIKADPDPPPDSSPIQVRSRALPGAAKKEPVFHPAPKFKPGPHPPAGPQSAGFGSSEAIKLELPPDTPQRQRKKQKDKYLPSGLASEVRDWLVDAKELFNPDPAPGADGIPSSVQLRLSQVQHAAGGAGMVVVAAQRPGQEAGEVKAILAGEGTTSRGGGLDKEKPVPKQGAMVSIGMPAWDVDLGQRLGTWAVAYRWEVVKEDEAKAGNKEG
ncbi:hypothetical protein QBC42DRAFT_199258 [Cladorrhinum samala]|uniref:Uncharacterized protein n=1 Tax=Cladorrhinum samala TaxID=585594 RepID=A0AAV9HVA5_9PEZI|nr:hypothetical protein QBC42DRAFT_199258 [Cladorrhinum samala]